MDITDIEKYIDPKLLIVVTACWVFGFMLKKTPSFPDWTIVWFVPALAIILTLFIIGITVEAFIQGILCGAFAVFGHQLVTQTREGVSNE